MTHPRQTKHKAWAGALAVDAVVLLRHFLAPALGLEAPGQAELALAFENILQLVVELVLGGALGWFAVYRVPNRTVIGGLAVLFIAGFTLTACNGVTVQPYAVGTPEDRFRTTCSGFYEILASLNTDRSIGLISDDLWERLDPHIELANGICQSDHIADYPDALRILEAVLVRIADEQQVEG